MRDDVILAEAAETTGVDSGAVAETAKALLAIRADRGFSIYNNNRSGRLFSTWRAVNKESAGPDLRGIKFTLQEESSHNGPAEKQAESRDDGSEEEEQNNVYQWVFAAVYDPELAQETLYVQYFLEKIEAITQNFRPAWMIVGTWGAQETFGPILQQRMQEVTYFGRSELGAAFGDLVEEEEEVGSDVSVVEDGKKGGDLVLRDKYVTLLQSAASVLQNRVRRVANMNREAVLGAVLNRM
jgi:hypothetical protein